MTRKELIKENEDLRYLEVNNAYEKQSGVKAGDIIGKRLREAFPDIERYWYELFFGEVIS